MANSDKGLRRRRTPPTRLFRLFILFDFGEKGFLTRKVNVLKEDVNKTNDYAIIICDCDTRRDACREASGQLSDGAFENCRVGKCETVFFGKI